MLKTRSVLAVIVAATALAGCTATALAAGSAAPRLHVHAIFGGGTPAPWHVGQVLQIDDGHRTMKKVCWSPAPVDRPACAAGNKVAAPSAAGTTTVTVTEADGTHTTTHLRVLAARTHYDGAVAVAGITRHPTAIYGNYDKRRNHFADREAVPALHTGDHVALYNHLGAGAIFVWHYADNQGGFVPTGDVAPSSVS